MNRRTFLAGAGMATITPLAGCAGVLGGEEASQEHDVGMSASRFLPASLEVSVGTTVVWANTGSRAHTVTAYDDKIPEEADYFASGGYENEEKARQAWMDGTGGAIHANETYEHTFEVPGRYTYFCIPHEAGGMAAQIIVEE